MSTANPLVVIDFEIAEISGLSDFDDQAELELRRRESDLREARAAVAELIEADRAYDDAQFGLARARYNGEPLEPWIQGCVQADLRRAAALARVGGAS